MADKTYDLVYVGAGSKNLVNAMYASKYGGLKVHRKATPFFLGLILGEFTMGSIWNIFGIILNVPIYHFWG